MGKTLSELAKEVHALAWTKGWHSEDESVDAFTERMCNNLHDEVSELHEAWRNNLLQHHCDKPGLKLTFLEEELADIIIRTLDNAQELGVDIERAVRLKHEYNKSRAYRHGGKKS